MNHAQRMLNFVSANVDGPIEEENLVRVADEAAKAFRPVTRLALPVKNPMNVGDGERLLMGAVFLFDDDSISLFGVTDTDRLLVLEVPIKDMPLDVRFDFIRAACNACDIPIKDVLESALRQTRPPGA